MNSSNRSFRVWLFGWFRASAAVLLILTVTPNSAEAQTTPAQTRQEPASGAANRAKPVEVALELRWRNEFRDNLDFQPADDFDHFLGQRLRINLKFRFHERFRLFVQAQDAWAFDAANDKIIHDLATNLHQAYFDWRLPGGDRWELRAGRQELIYGEERLVGAFGWDTVGRSFDAGRLRYAGAPWTADLFWGRVVDVRRNGARRRAGHQDLSGVYVTHSPAGAPGRTEIFGLFLRDGLRSAGELGIAPQSTRIMTLGFRRAWRPQSGWQYSLENAWQFGERGPDGHFAAMLVTSAGYAWGGRWAPRWRFEYALGSGDGNPTDGRSREFHNLFPTNHLYYGFADLAGLRNLHAFRFTAGIKLLPKLSFAADYHRFLLVTRRGPWKNAGGRVLGFDPSGQSGRDIGQEWDFTVQLPLHRIFQMQGGYSFLLPGGFARSTRGPETHHFAYLQSTLRF